MVKNGAMAQSESTLMSFRGLPGPRGLPVLGNLHRIRLDRLHLIVEDWAEQYGEIFRIRIGPYHIAVVSDRAAIQRLLVQRPEGFRRTVTLESVATESASMASSRPKARTGAGSAGSSPPL